MSERDRLDGPEPMARDDDEGPETSAATRTERDAIPARWVAPRFSLSVVSGAPRHEKSIDDTRASVGSHPSNDFVVEHDTVSRFHCEIEPTEDGYVVRDLRSRNGTLVDGVRISEAWLGRESTLRLGDVTVRFARQEQRSAPSMSSRDRFGSLVGRSASMRTAFAVLEACARSASTVLIEGETGTGKEAAAEAIHDESERASSPFVIVDCSAIPANLLESELFGHEKGAFTGAATARAGAFEAAHGGTVFLDEIGELPLDLQPKLLRVLEQRTIRRLGSTARRSIDVRVLAATNRDLRAEVNEGRFRSDLYYRIAVLRVRLPSLRERLEDLPLLSEEILRRIHASDADISRLVSPESLRRMRGHRWPGNVRELRNYLERAVAFADVSEDAAGATLASSEAPAIDASEPYVDARRRAIRDFELAYVEKLLRAHDGNVSKAARAAGIGRVYLHRLMRRVGEPGS